MSSKSRGSISKMQPRRRGKNRPRPSSIAPKSSRAEARRIAKQEREAAKARKAVHRASRDVVRLFDTLVGSGLYSPRKVRKRAKTRTRKGGLYLTRGQEQYIKRRARGAYELLKEHIVVIPRGSAKHKARTIKAAKKAGYRTTKKATFVSRSGGVENAYYETDRAGRSVLVTVKPYEVTKTPLVTIDELMREKDRLRRSFDRLTKKTKKGQHIRFYVEGKYGSNAVFSASRDGFEALWRNMLEYRDKIATQYVFAHRLSLGIARHGMGRNKVTTKRERDVARARRAAVARRKMGRARR